jgi:exodeoxyribonuclease V alpha subunit
VEELNGIVEKVEFTKDTGFIRFLLRDGHNLHVVIGDNSDVHEADVVKCEGVFGEFRGKPQFRAKIIIPQIPSTTEAIIDFLASGRIKGIKTQYANRLVKAFGKDVISVIENEPERLKEVSGFGPARIKTLVEGLKDQIGFRSILIFLHNFGLNKRLIKKIYQQYGVNAVEKIQKNPYALCYEIEGVGFAIADRIGVKAGMKPDDPNRVMAGLTFALNQVVNSTGSTGVKRDELSKQAFNLFSKSGYGISQETIQSGIDVLIESPFCKIVEVAGERCIFPTYLHDAEVGIARHLKRLQDGFKHRRGKQVNNHIKSAQEIIGVELADAQLDAVKMSLLNAVSVITGGPGTGKTTIVRVILEVLKSEYGIKSEDILLCAPTGKAAMRLSDSSGMEAKTLHRALSYSPDSDGFLHDEDTPLEAKVILADEASMMDTQLTYWSPTHHCGR